MSGQAVVVLGVVLIAAYIVMKAFWRAEARLKDVANHDRSRSVLGILTARLERKKPVIPTGSNHPSSISNDTRHD